MLSLIIETCTDLGIVAIVREGKLLYHSQLPPGQQNSKVLLPEIQSALQNTHVQLKDVDFIGVGIGPGSYTGIRMGVITAKALAFAAEIPLVGLCTLHNFIPDIDGPFTVLIDAKISGAYVICGNRNKEQIHYITEPQVVELSQLPNVFHGKPYTMVSPNPGRIKPFLESIDPKCLGEWEIKGPDPLAMYRSAMGKFQRNDLSLDGHLEIMYLRKTQAEIEREKKIQGS
jgi:tRNA threonylcarbamoyladenosine biosynthesis protein TsaB